MGRLVTACLHPNAGGTVLYAPGNVRWRVGLGTNPAIAVRGGIPNRHCRGHMIQYPLDEAFKRLGHSVLAFVIEESVRSRFAIEERDMEMRATSRQSLVGLGHERREQAVFDKIFLDGTLEHESPVGSGNTVECPVIDLDLTWSVFDVVSDDIDTLILQNSNEVVDRRHVMCARRHEDRLSAEYGLASLRVDNIELVFVAYFGGVTERRCEGEHLLQQKTRRGHLKPAIVPHRIADHAAGFLQPGHRCQRVLIDYHDAVLVVHFFIVAGIAHWDRITVESDGAAIEVQARFHISGYVTNRDRLSAAKTSHVRQLKADELEAAGFDLFDKRICFLRGG